MSGAQERTGVRGKVAGSARRAGKLWAWSLFGDVQGEIGRIKAVVAALAQRSKRTPVVETFEQAIARLGVTEDDLRSRLDSLRRMDWIYMASAAVAFVLAVAAPWSPRPLSQFCMAAAVMAMCVCKALACRYRIAQIRQRRLMSFSEWMRQE